MPETSDRNQWKIDAINPIAQQAMYRMEQEDVQSFLDDLNHFDSVGPILDPTGWMRNTKKVDRVKKLVRAFAEFKKVCHEVFEEELAEITKAVETAGD